MVGYLDEISRYGYNNMYGVGLVGTPMITGAMDPVAAYQQQNPQGLNQATSQIPAQMNGQVAGQTSLHNLNGSPANQSGIGFNVNTANMVLGGLNTIGSLWQAWEANKLAKEQFKFSKEAWNTNLANQIQAYNTTLQDKIFSRYHTQNMSAEDAQKYIDANKLQKKTL